MKNLTNKTLFSFMMFFCMTTFVLGQANTIDQLFGNSHFNFDSYDQEIIVNMDKAPWEAFTFSLTNEDFFNNPVCKIQVKAYEDMALRIDLSDGETVFENVTTIKDIAGDDVYHELVFDFSDVIYEFKQNAQPHLILYVNPGVEYSGELFIKNIEFATTQDETTPANTEILTELSVYPNPASDVVNIEMPESFDGKVIISDVSGREVYNFEASSNSAFGNVATANVSNLTSGTYFVSLVGQGNVLSSRIQIN